MKNKYFLWLLCIMLVGIAMLCTTFQGKAEEEKEEKKEDIVMTIQPQVHATFRLFLDENETQPYKEEGKEVELHTEEDGTLSVPFAYKDMYLSLVPIQGYRQMKAMKPEEKAVPLEKLSVFLELPKEENEFELYHNDTLLKTLKASQDIGAYLEVYQTYTVKAKTVPPHKKANPLTFTVTNEAKQIFRYTYIDLFYTHIELNEKVEGIKYTVYTDEECTKTYADLQLTSDFEGKASFEAEKGTYYIRVSVEDATYYELLDTYKVKTEETLQIQLAKVNFTVLFNDASRYRVEIKEGENIIETYQNDGMAHIVNAKRNTTYTIRPIVTQDLLSIPSQTVTTTNTKSTQEIKFESKPFVTHVKVLDENGNRISHIKLSLYNKNNGQTTYVMSEKEDVIVKGYYEGNIIAVAFAGMKEGYYGDMQIEITAGKEDIVMYVHRSIDLTLFHDGDENVEIDVFKDSALQEPLTDFQGMSVVVTKHKRTYKIPEGTYYFSQVKESDHYYPYESEVRSFAYANGTAQSYFIHMTATQVNFRIVDENQQVLSDVLITLTSENDTQTVMANESVYLKRNETYAIDAALPKTYRLHTKQEYTLPSQPQKDLVCTIYAETSSVLTIRSKGKTSYIKASYSIYRDENMTQLVKSVDDVTAKGESDETGAFQIVLHHGDYYLRQDSVDGHYWQFEKPRLIHVDKESHDIILQNMPVLFKTVSEDESGNPVIGVKYGLFDALGNEISSWVSTDAETEIQSEKLVSDMAYQIRQLEVPKGYVKDETILTITLPRYLKQTPFIRLVVHGDHTKPTIRPSKEPSQIPGQTLSTKPTEKKNPTYLYICGLIVFAASIFAYAFIKKK